jgi:hypothetical protein
MHARRSSRRFQMFDFTDERLRVIQASDPADQSAASFAVTKS